MPHVELPQAEFKVVMLGDTNTGKTSLVLRFAEGYYREKSASTVGAFFITKRIQTRGGITCKIQIWDTAGQEQFRAMAPMYYRTAAAAIVCYDITSAKSFRIMKDWLDELHRNIPAGSIVIAIAATKKDLTSLEEVPHAEAEDLARDLGAIFVDTSAKENEGVDDIFGAVAERVLRFREQDGSVIPVTPGGGAGRSGRMGSGMAFKSQYPNRHFGGGGGGANGNGFHAGARADPLGENGSPDGPDARADDERVATALDTSLREDLTGPAERYILCDAVACSNSEKSCVIS
mmetsp:Transcript_26134/g.52083  ORF Transcript_26134/g.52083 Transcript_26134/m.52083 type:complete len:290 (+) Transcript_26134:393-1262(+)|eukprot:CAMPEP_0194303482 /NCGR_PEP_ID=MMETSP0171-20130528/1338_1 /TAXON_ID=218684 /ORGANISM="Corethron pennatum, Strain L29A3" /LENGTH=289 /DNA_ID=CAMNT_0039054397 /DNA_START=335 /DNA_END=1204 /DNA_ORIENTATION=+